MEMKEIHGGRSLKMNKRDGILVLVLLVLAVAGYLAFAGDKKTEGNQVVITIDGAVYGSYPLKPNKEIEIETESGCNTVKIEDGKVYMEDADCPDRYCVKQGKISHSKETLICLPHKLVVEVEFLESESEQEKIDVIAK